MDQETVDAVLADWRTAPIDEKLRSMLGFLEKLTLSPDAVTAEDAVPLREAGLSESAMVDAVYVCALFNLIDRVADALGFEPDEGELLIQSAKFLLGRGYQ